ncbi:MAG: hypothetical protein ACO3YY_02355 [Phycisphaerales bacterium]
MSDGSDWFRVALRAGAWSGHAQTARFARTACCERRAKLALPGHFTP